MRELADGDELRVGNTRFLVQVALTLPEGADPVPADGEGQPDGAAEVGAYLCVPVL